MKEVNKRKIRSILIVGLFQFGYSLNKAGAVLRDFENTENFLLQKTGSPENEMTAFTFYLLPAGLIFLIFFNSLSRYLISVFSRK